MTYFDENKPYWGNQTKPLIGAGNERLTARSVKIFADGTVPMCLIKVVGLLTLLISRCSENWWSVGKYLASTQFYA
jgi:hypothetical protein